MTVAEFGNIPLGFARGSTVYPSPEFQNYLRTILERTGGSDGSSILSSDAPVFVQTTAKDFSPVSVSVEASTLAPVAVSGAADNNLEPV